jgi:uroporphyrinogen III methyltransferase/synthase
MSERMSGRVYLVGAGPGDPGLLTLRGRELLAAADVVVYDYLVSPRLLDHAPERAERIYVGKRASAHTLSQEGINQILIEKARAGKVVVRLKGGDPFIFGRGGEEALALAQAGVPWEVAPGVTAGAAAPAYAGIPLTHRDLASSVAFITGHEGEGKESPAIDWKAIAAWKGTLVFYMGVGNLRTICAELTGEGLAADTPAAAVRWGTLPRQETVAGTVGTLPDLVEAAGLKAPALIVIGRVVALREKLAWFERRPLFGRRIVVTRSQAQAGELAGRLEALGAEVLQAPTFRVEPPEDPEPLRSAAARLERFEWVIFTSGNAVEALFGALAEAGRDARALAACKVCAVGPATAERLRDFGIRADAVPPRYTGEAMVETLAAMGALSGAHVLCPRADIAPPDMVEALAARGAQVEEVIAYRNVAVPLAPEQVEEIFGEEKADWLTFTSSSAVRGFLSRLDRRIVAGSGVRIASIGPATSDTVREFGFKPTVEAEPHTLDALVNAIISMETSTGAGP